ncbi:MAG: hypothetical protein ABEL76_10870, partial [Bradymonadaceae bacterium]
MALQDIRRGRGVTVLDPHGTLVDDLLARIPEDRVDDVVLLDATDRQRPVPFNPLRIEADSERAYRRRRDRVIDAFMRYVEARFPEEYYGPIFETHLRGMLGLLLGSTPQDPARVPNLMLLFGLYSNEEFRDRMIEKRRGEDLMIDSFVDEVRQASYDASFDEMGTYVTSKFNRFVFDRTLRNITCQPDALDIEACVEDRKILLVSLGKGRFGDLSAGLLASQIVDRLRSAVLGRQTAEPAHYLYADEFQLFAGQQFGQLDREVIDSVLGNVGTRIAFRVGAADAERLAPEFRPRFSEEDLVSLSNYRCCVAPTGELGELPFTLETRPYRETA